MHFKLNLCWKNSMKNVQKILYCYLHNDLTVNIFLKKYLSESARESPDKNVWDNYIVYLLSVWIFRII